MPYKSHQKTNVEYQCPRCEGMPFSSLARLAVHYEDHHPGNDREVQSIRPVSAEPARVEMLATRRSPSKTLAPASAGRPPSYEGQPPPLTEDSMTEPLPCGEQPKSSCLSAPSPVDSDIPPNANTSDQVPLSLEACEQQASVLSQSQAVVQKNGKEKKKKWNRGIRVRN